MDVVPNFPALNARNGLGYWFGAFVLGNLASLFVLMVVWRPADESDTFPVWVTALSAAAMWLVFAAFLRMLSRGIGSGSMRHDFGLAFRFSDVLVGIPVGVLSQFVLVNLVNLPLVRLFPDRFSAEEIEKRAQELSDSAPGAWFVVLVLMVVVFAPLIEELVYRGLVQQGLANSIPAGRAWVGAAALFAGIHLVPIEFPGLFAFALVLGWCYRRTGRLGLGIVAHMAFNASGLLVVAVLN